MLLVEETVAEVMMIVAVIVAVACLAHLLQLSIREQLYLRRVRRRYLEAVSAVVRRVARLRRAPAPAPVRRFRAGP